jgi:hypothetical protein
MSRTLVISTRNWPRHVFGVLGLAAAPVVAMAQAEPDFTPQRIDAKDAPTIDGVLDEEVWSRAAKLGPLTQVVPAEGGTPSQRTEVLFAFDSEALYVGVRCFDDDVASLRATQRRRDANLDPDDSIELLVDPFLDRRNAFWFQIGPGGARGDALIVKNGQQFNKRWDGIWQGRSTITDEGWSAELEIPFATLNFREDQTTWGFNFRRFVRRVDEEDRWATPSRDVRFFSVADAGLMSGMSGLEQGLGFDITPFVVGDWQAFPEGLGAEDGNVEFGLDAFWRPTPDTKLSVSYNTDFAQTEVDQTQVNLTRFGLFFPEKRDFFLEDSGNFYFSAPSGVVPFFSRRIGLEGGEVVPLIGAIKYTGQTDNATFGLLDAVTDRTVLDPDGAPETLASQNLFAARYSQNFNAETDAGLIFTHGDPSGKDHDAATIGLDWAWRTSDYNGKNLRINASALAATNDPDGTEDGLPTAFNATVDYPNDELDWFASVSQIGSDFDPALGFVRRRGVRRYAAGLTVSPRFDDSDWLRQLQFEVEPTLYTDSTGRFETLDINTDVIGFRFESGDRATLKLLHTIEELDESFDVLDGIGVTPGRYSETRVGISLRAADRREVSGRLEVFGGEFWDGTRTDIVGRLNWRPGPLFSTTASFERNEIDLAAGSFDVNVARLRTDLVFTPDLSWSGDLQWDNVSESLGFNSRVWWILGPGRELFFVVNQGWDTSDGITPTGTGVALKLGYTLRY